VIKTAFTELVGVDHPITLAGMSRATSPELVAAVSIAGVDALAEPHTQSDPPSVVEPAA
jgi:NAD(P)H-dependent flavin oxidoreductase YrpB (nitropropane dioxygenase family)